MKMTKYILGGLLIMLSVTFCSLFVISSKAETKTESRPECYYTSVKIGLDDTLDSIAEEYNTTDYYSNSNYIDEIKRINNLYTDIIHPGCYLTVMCF